MTILPSSVTVDSYLPSVGFNRQAATFINAPSRTSQRSDVRYLEDNMVNFGQESQFVPPVALGENNDQEKTDISNVWGITSAILGSLVGWSISVRLTRQSDRPGKKSSILVATVAGSIVGGSVGNYFASSARGKVAIEDAIANTVTSGWPILAGIFTFGIVAGKSIKNIEQIGEKIKSEKTRSQILQEQIKLQDKIIKQQQDMLEATTQRIKKQKQGA